MCEHIAKIPCYPGIMYYGFQRHAIIIIRVENYPGII